MTNAQILSSLGTVAYEPSCVIAIDESEVVRHAAPLDERARLQLREQAIAKLQRDPVAIHARERRIAIATGGKVREIRRRA